MRLILVLALILLAATSSATITNVTVHPASTSITISWRSDVTEHNDYVDLAVGGVCTNLSLTASTTDVCAMLHSVLITNLSPATLYCLQPGAQFCPGQQYDYTGPTIQVSTNAYDTATATPSNTPILTSTWTPTNTPVVTVTSSVTQTKVITPTASPTVSPTPNSVSQEYAAFNGLKVTVITTGGSTVQGVCTVNVDYMTINGVVVPFTSIASITVISYPTLTPSH